DVTNPAAERKLTPKPAENRSDHPRHVFSLDELGYSIEPAHTYAVRIDPSLTAADGQQLGYTWMGVIEYWHERAFTSFGDGHGVWEAGGGPVLPFYSRNFRNVRQWAAPLEPHELMPTLLALANSDFTATPKTRPRDRNLSPIADEIQSFGLDIASVLGPDGKGLAWVAVQEGETIERARTYHDAPRTRATLVQVTNLGLTVKDSPQNTLVFVTRLDDGSPVAGANVSIRDVENKVVWSGTTDAKGIAVAPNTPLRLPKKEEKRESPPDEEMAEEQSWEDNWTALEQIHFVVIAEKEGDVAYSVSNWHDGITPWDFGANFDLGESAPLLRGSIFSDRGVYKLGEEVHLKAIVRSDTPDGMKLLPAGAKLEVVMRDSHDQEADRRTLTLNDWSSAEWTVRIPNDRPLGTWAVTGFVEGTRLSASGRFLVAAYRRPDFRVDVTLDGGDGTSSLAGNDLAGTIRARYLFGAPMSGREVEWTYAKRAVFDVPSPIRNRFPGERYVFLGWDETVNRSWTTLRSDAGELDAKGEQKLALDTDRAAGWPYEYRLEGEVTDVSRQKIAGRAVRRVDPAPWYIGVKAPPFFADAKSGVATEIVAAAVDGTAVAGVNVTVELKQIQWTSVRRAEGNGFYTWETERKEVPAGKWSVTTAAQPVPLQIDVPRGGYYEVIARASDAEGRSTRTRLSFYAVGDGYTAWERFDHNRIDLVPEKKRYRPGETARIMIKSPWEEATALLTVEREGVRSHQQFKLTSTQPTVSVPITGRDIPNVFVSVVLIKGRTKEAVAEDASDPGKPAFRVGYVELDVEDATKRLAVDVKANRDEYRPASKARIDVSVRDAQGRPSQSEVTLWAVDYGVLSLTAYQTPDILDDVYIRKALQVVTGDSREKIISRRVLTPKGASEGGGGGVDAGPGTLRKDFRVLAFWLGSVVTDRRGHARAGVTLPESLTTYRIMAVAGDRESRFGWGESEIRVNKPLLLLPAFPRFLSVGDKALFGAVVHSQLARGGGAAVTIRSLTPGVLEFSESRKEVTIAPKASAEVRFDAVAKAAGEAKVQVTVKMGGESDGFEETVPVRVLVSPESVAAYGEAKPQAQETVAIPKDAIPGFGGMTLQVASTAMAGLGEGARYLVDYPYGCAEQKSSSALALMLASHLGEAFALPGVDARKARGIAQATLDEMKTYQCGDGGFAFWPGDCAWASPYLTAYVLHVHQRGKNLGFAVDDAMLQRGYEFLERSLGQPRPDNEGWMPAYTAWQAFAVKVLTEGGRNADSHINRFYG
ncbi:MAG TPA: MG2 domain-containing protein, partial [Thermoanaerobaculia bacterium]|nr:MG2 domain-containing protein [Thermoanaerobaculia bacterium]